MKKLAILTLAFASFSMAACPKVYQDAGYKGFTIYELPNKTVYICDYQSGCGTNKLYTYFVINNKKAEIDESQINVGGTLKTYDSENRITHETFHDYRRQALRTALETERANCLLKN